MVFGLHPEFAHLFLRPIEPDDRPPYEAEKLRSEEIDLHLGISYAEETSVPSRDHETWSHLSPQIFQTPYPELMRIVDDADPKQTGKRWVDLGAAYGRLGIVLAATRRNSTFVGMEVLPSRVATAKAIYARLGLNPDSMTTGNCESDPLPAGDIYFIYDFGTREAVNSALEKIKTEARSRSITVIGRGRRVRDLIEREHPWLGYVVPPLHRDHYSVYHTSL